MIILTYVDDCIIVDPSMAMDKIDSERISEWGHIWASISIGTYQGNLFCREFDRGQYSSMRLRKSELSVQQSMRLSRMMRRLRSSSAFSAIGTERRLDDTNGRDGDVRDSSCDGSTSAASSGAAKR